MGRPSKIPDLIESLKTISITDLKKLGYIKDGQILEGTITWSRNGHKTGSISIRVDTFSMIMGLSYTYQNETEIKSKVFLITRPSNLGKGNIYYFVCPRTWKTCRKLYQNGSLFLHRSTLNGYLYEKQTYSKSNRTMFKMYENLNAQDEVYKKHFKKWYNGQPTKRYKRLFEKIKRGARYSIEELMIYGK